MRPAGRWVIWVTRQHAHAHGHARQADGRAAGRPLGHLGHLGQKKIGDPNDPKEKGRGIQGIPWRAGYWVIWVIWVIARQVLAYDVRHAQDYVAI